MPFDADLDELLAEVVERARPLAREGEVADYLPSLASADAGELGMAVVEMDGTEHTAGAVDVPFSIQSISKVFALALAMRESGADGGDEAHFWDRVGREPSGDPFNSLVQLEHEHGIPRNPMINAGALVVDDVLLEHCDGPAEVVLDLVSELAGEAARVDEDVLAQEAGAGDRNRAMAHLMSGFGNLRHGVDEVLELYTRQCSIAMTARQLARAVRFLANRGQDPATGEQVVTPAVARRVGAIMLTCGAYDAAGEFAFQVGLPCKSGVAGGIVATVTGELGICVWSPPLDRAGNSVAGRAALADLSEQLGVSLV